MNPEAPLPTFRIDPGTSVARTLPQAWEAVTAASPALAVLTDLTRVQAATIAPTATLSQAEQDMIHRGVRMLFVVTESPSIEGLVTAADLQGDRAMRAVHDRGLHHDELRVADVMTPLAAIDVIDFDALPHATVGNLVATLQRHGRDHLLVVQEATAQTPRRVRGLISRTQIERQLGQRIDVAEIARDFAEIERALL